VVELRYEEVLQGFRVHVSHNCYCPLLSTQLWVCPTWTVFPAVLYARVTTAWGVHRLRLAETAFGHWRGGGCSWEYINKKLRTADKRWCSTFGDLDEEPKNHRLKRHQLVAFRVSDLDSCLGTTLTKKKSQGWNFGMWGACISQGRFIPGLTNLWHASFIAAQIFFISFARPASLCCKVIPLQARCGPEDGYRYSSTLP